MPLHNAIMEAGGKDRPPMLAPSNYVVPVDEGSTETTIERYMENYKNVSQDIHDQLNAKAKVVQIILTWIDNDIYSTVDACPNACEIWKAIERLKQDATRNRGKAIVNSPRPIYDQEPSMIAEDDEMSKDKEIDKLMALISLSFKKIYTSTNNNLRTSSNTSTPVVHQSGIQCYNCKEYGHVAICQKLKRTKEAAYHKEKMLLCKQEEAGFQLNAEQAEWRDGTNDEPEDQELEAHYMYMAQIHEVTPDAADNSRPIFDSKPLQKLVEIILFIVDSGCSKHMTGNLNLLTNFVEKFLGLNHNLFSLCQFCDADLEVAFRKSTCYISHLKGNDLLTGSRGIDLYSITLQDTSSPNLICLMAKATSSQAWLWHRHLSHLNFDTINLLSKNDIVIRLLKLKFIKHLYSFCELGKAKRKSFQTKTTPSSKRRLQLLHMDLCGPMRVKSINGKKYVLVIVDDYSRYTCTHFLRSKDEAPEVLINFLRLVQPGLHAQVRIVRTDKGTEFLNKTLHAYFASEGINHQTSVARTPKQNGVVKRRNRTLVEAARTMLSAAKVPLFFWVEAIATACFTQNRSLVIPRHEKTPYHIINDHKPSVKFFYIFCSFCYIIGDGENLDKMKEKGNACICVGYSTQSRAYRVINKRTRVIMETIHANFDELPQMASDHVSSDPVPQCQRTALEHDSLSPDPQSQENVPIAAGTVTTSNELDLLFNPTQAPTVTSTENINQAETITENAQVEDDEFINIFCTPVQDRGEPLSRRVDSSNMHTFYQRHPSEHRWMKDHPLEQVIRNPSQSVRTRRQQESDGEMCMFALTMSRTEPKNIKEAMADSAWIESMQEELHQFDRLDVWELVDRPLCKNAINMKWLWKNKHSDHVGCLDSRKSTSSGIQFLGGDKALMYLAASRPDIVHATCYCARYQAKPTEKHLTMVKRIFRYLKDTINMGLWYLTDTSFELTAFQIRITWAVSIHVAIAISCNLVQHSRTKHIDVRYHFIKEKVEKGIIELFFVGTEYQLADLFTKDLSEDRFKYLVRRLGMRCLTPEEPEALANESA
uniref:Integrase catalytic domain-containing protein n=1 Tax=Tanacetum cinerariifolium TaxID=118510 RepID=A0A6L2L9P8_TANCI|nr:hypothetical protein [Tanacetum cinerariifolium]